LVCNRDAPLPALPSFPTRRSSDLTFIAPQNPYDWLVPITGTKKSSVRARILCIEDIGWLRVVTSPIISPGGQHADEQAQLFSLIDDVIRVAEVSFVGSLGVPVD